LRLHVEQQPLEPASYAQQLAIALLAPAPRNAKFR